MAELARLLDDVRPLIVEARYQGERPRFLLLDGADFDAVAACKATDKERGMPMMVLGMEIVRADHSTDPRVF
jgi:hypothetical protein